MSNPTHRDGRPKKPRPFASQLRRVFAEIPPEDLPADHRHTLGTMADYARPDGTGAFPSIATLCAVTAIGRTRMICILRELRVAGWVASQRRASPGGTRMSNAYVMKLWGRPIVPSSARAKRPGRYDFGATAKNTTH